MPAQMHLITGTVLALLTVGAWSNALQRMQMLQHKRAKQFDGYFRDDSAAIDAEHTLKRQPSRFLNTESAKFAVDGATLPNVNFDVGESYAGVLPISDHPDEPRKLRDYNWLQGGPGGASTGGLLLENGPFLWQPGTARPTRNTFSWNNLTNMVWIDQPVGTGFSVGSPNITNEYKLADQFMGFFKNFVDLFRMHGYSVYLTGESYTGYYIPYIANSFLEANDSNYFNLKGAAINDPIIGNEIVQFEGVAMQYLDTWSQVFGLDTNTMDRIRSTNHKCGYDEYLERYFTFPAPPHPSPAPFGDANFGTNIPEDCDIQSDIIEAAQKLNPCFNFDHILDTCPFLYSLLGIGLFMTDFNPPGPSVWYDRSDVRKAIHAPSNVTWKLASSQNVFVGKDETWEVVSNDISLPPAQIDIFSKVIEATNNVILGAGALDFQLPANGTLFVLQNMTWHDAQGFSVFPDKTLYVPQHPVVNKGSLSGHGNMGSWTSERGLTFYISGSAGHEVAWYAPGVAYRVLQVLLGRISDLSALESF